MGTCTCGKKTVWNDMCEDCNNEFENQIYSLDEYREENPKRAVIYRQAEEKVETFFSSDILNIHISLLQVVGISSLDMSGSYFDIILANGNRTVVETKRNMHDYNTIMNEHQRMIEALNRVYRR
jgi:hypothetical protein